MLVSEGATLLGIEPFASWNTPIAWTGFILFADAFLHRARGNSWLRSAPREFAWLTLASIPLWGVFEGYNLVLDNWYYSDLPDNFWLRQFGHAWSFATRYRAAPVWLGFIEVALHCADHGRPQELRNAGPRRSRLSAICARMFHRVCVCSPYVH